MISRGITLLSIWANVGSGRFQRPQLRQLMRNTHGKLNFLGSAPHNTVANATYERLKHDIIFGKLKPGAKLKLETL